MKTNCILLKCLSLAIFAPILLSLTSCYDDFHCIRGRGIVTNEAHNVKNFTGIDLRIPAKVLITQGDEFSMEIETYQNIQEEIITYVTGGTLVIETDVCIRVLNDEIEIRITAPDFAKLRIYGSGLIQSTNVLVVPDISLYISGSGEIDLSLQTSGAESRISGSGKIILEGQATEHSLRIDGSGKIACFDLNTSNTEINISGSGKCDVLATRTLEVIINGSGTVRYKGYPAITSYITGSGRIINAN